MVHILGFKSLQRWDITFIFIGKKEYIKSANQKRGTRSIHLKSKKKKSIITTTFLLVTTQPLNEVY